MDFLEVIASQIPSLKTFQNFVVLFPEIPQVSKKYFQIHVDLNGKYLMFKDEVIELDISLYGKKLQEIRYLNGLKNGVYRSFDGTVITEEGRYINDQKIGLWIERYSDGSPWVRRNYLNGRLHGLSLEFYRNGEMSSEGNFVNGREEGLWNFWNEDGTLRNQVRYNNGNFIEHF